MPGHCPRNLKHNVRDCASDYACLVTESYMDVLELVLLLLHVCRPSGLTYLEFSLKWTAFFPQQLKSWGLELGFKADSAESLGSGLLFEV